MRISLRDAGRQVRLELDGVEGVALAEIEHLLLLLGAEPTASGYAAPVLDFRRAAVEIARQLRRAGVSVELDDDVTALLRQQLEEIRARPKAIDELEALSDDDVIRRIQASGRLRTAPNPRQVENLGRLLSLRHGANFSVPGAGKTSTLLALYEALRAEQVVDRLLVVAPKNAFISWEEEVERCYAEDTRPTVRRLVGGPGGVSNALADDPEIGLIGYQLLPNVEGDVKTWARRHRVHVTLDESHRVKSGHAGVTAAAALDLSGVAVRRDILSGTPLPQSPEDLRPQLGFLWPGQRILPDVRVLREAGAEGWQDVRRAVMPLYVRTTKNQLGLPDLVPKPVPVKMGPLQQELYEVLRSEAARVASGMGRQDQRFFRALGRQVMGLLQAAVNPMLLTRSPLVAGTDLEPVPEGTRAWDLLREIARYEQPAKIAKAVERAEQIIGGGDKVLIWSQFVMNVQALERLLAHHGAVVLYGGVPVGDEEDTRTREGRIKAFHDDPNTKVMIANPAAAGEGISLHKACHRALYLDRSFNAAHYMQSVDRIHRLGLGPDVKPRVEILHAVGTIDDRVNERLKTKLAAMKVILNDPGLDALAYDPSDVTEAAAAGIDPEDVDVILEHLQTPSDSR